MGTGHLFMVGTPIGNLSEMTFRGLEVLRSADIVYCEDTRRTLKLLNHFELKKKLRSAPAFKEKKEVPKIVEELKAGKTICFVSDAGMPGLSDPGQLIVRAARQADIKVEIVGGPSALTSFIAGLGRDPLPFLFAGFLPAREKDRRSFFQNTNLVVNTFFFESPHRIESTLQILCEVAPQSQISLAKEISKISESFFEGSPAELLSSIPSFKGEWIGCLWGKT